MCNSFKAIEYLIDSINVFFYICSQQGDIKQQQHKQKNNKRIKGGEERNL